MCVGGVAIVDLQEVITWLKRLVNLDTRVFDEIRTNPTATIPGTLVALVSLFIAGLGGWLWWVVEKYPDKKDIFVHSAVFGAIFAFVLWAFIWVGLVYVVLTQFFRERAYVEQLLRVMGLAAAPLALMGLMFIPEISFAIGLAALVLAYGLSNIAIRSVTSADPARVMIANVLGFFVWCAALTLLAKASNPNSPGIFLFNSINHIVHDAFHAAR